MLLTIKEAVDYTGTSLSSVWRAVENNKVRMETHQGIRLVVREDVDKRWPNACGPLPQYPYMPDTYLTLRDAAEQMDSTVAYLRWLTSQGKIKSVLKGRVRLIHPNWLKEYKPKIGRPPKGDSPVPRKEPTPPVFCTNEGCDRRVYKPRPDGLCSICRKKAGGYTKPKED